MGNSLDTSVKTYVDYNIFGETDRSGQIIRYTGISAVINAVQAWLASSQWCLVRRPQYGGKVFPFLLKPMTDETADAMRQAIIRDLESEFIPRLHVSECEVLPDYEQDLYHVHLTLSAPSLRDSGTLSVSLRRIFT